MALQLPQFQDKDPPSYWSFEAPESGTCQGPPTLWAQLNVMLSAPWPRPHFTHMPPILPNHHLTLTSHLNCFSFWAPCDVVPKRNNPPSPEEAVVLQQSPVPAIG
jgi:hypothetical protein